MEMVLLGIIENSKLEGTKHTIREGSNMVHLSWLLKEIDPALEG